MISIEQDDWAKLRKKIVRLGASLCYRWASQEHRDRYNDIIRFMQYIESLEYQADQPY